MGIFIDEPAFIEIFSGFKNLSILANIQNKICNEDIIAVMDKVGLDTHNDTIVKNYSLGMKQKLGIAQAIMEDQDILLLDEPFNALDEDSHDKMIKLLVTLKNEGKTILLTSHNNDDLNELCDKIYSLSNGQLTIQ